jgi:hypothetical protein
MLMTENQLILLIAAILVVAGVGYAIYRNHKHKLHARRRTTTRLGHGHPRPIESLGQQ